MFGTAELSYVLSLSGFAEEVNEADLSFVVNWAGSHVLDMEVNDRLCQETLVKLIRAFEELQPNIKGPYF